MQFDHIKRSISLLLVLVMVFSMCPLQAFAAVEEHHDHAELAAEAVTRCNPCICSFR